MIEKYVVADLKERFIGKKSYKSTFELISDCEKYWNKSINERSIATKFLKSEYRLLLMKHSHYYKNLLSIVCI